MSELIAKLALQKGKGRTPQALARIAAKLGVEQDALGAFIEVEASGSGYDSRGRLKILDEKHYFWKHLPPEKRAEAVKLGLARKGWLSPKNGGYADQKTPDAKWELLRRMAAFDEEAALKSASLGAGQIMGAHAEWLGYGTPAEFWSLCAADEDAQIEAMGRFLTKAGLIDEMRRKDWRGLAGGYNGPGQIDIYAPRLKAAYNKLQKIPDVELDDLLPLPNEETATVPLGPKPPLIKGADGSDVIILQTALKAKGFPITIDGDFGPGTERAVKDFQRQSNLAVDGHVGRRTWDALGLAA